MVNPAPLHAEEDARAGLELYQHMGVCGIRGTPAQKEEYYRNLRAFLGNFKLKKIAVQTRDCECCVAERVLSKPCSVHVAMYPAQEVSAQD